MQMTLEQFHQAYDTETQDIKIGKRRLSFLKPKSIDRFIDGSDTLQDFPLWTKVWEPSLILCSYLADLPVTPGQRLLEIGAGLGVTGVVAASLGHDVTITEYNADALHFIRANAQINGCPQARVQHLDWERPGMNQQFDLIFGSEITYKVENIPFLTTLFNALLAPGGTIVLAEEVRATGTAFMDAMEPNYHIEARKHLLRSTNKSMTVIMFKLEARPA